MSTPRAIVVSIGEEILEGRITDSNSRRFAAELLRLGFQVREMATIGDAPGALRSLLEDLRDEWELVLTTGGLGPTVDDRVRAEAAAVLAVPLVEASAGAEERLERLYRRQHGRAAPRPFLDQARVPLGAVPLANAAGTAWGFSADLGATRLICLPGPPREAEAAWGGGGARDGLEERFRGSGRLAFGSFHTAGVPESHVEHLLRDLMEEGGNPRMGIIAGPNRVTVSVKAFPEGGRSAEEVLAAAGAEVRRRLGDLCWGGDAETLEGVVVAALRAREATVATAESCTGGRLAAALTAVPGASAVFHRGWVTYSDEAKTAALGVDPELLARHGAVSPQVAAAMAAGARERAGAVWAVAVTGIAGPGGGSAKKPVGLIWLGLCGPEGTCTIRRRQYARAGRSVVQELSVRDALEALRRRVLGIADLPDRE